MFFTFWDISMLKKSTGRKGASSLPYGIEAALMRRQMRNKKVQALPELIQTARELGVKIVACSVSMHVMEIPREDLVGVDEFAGVASFLRETSESRVTLFI